MWVTVSQEMALGASHESDYMACRSSGHCSSRTWIFWAQISRFSGLNVARADSFADIMRGTGPYRVARGLVGERQSTR